MQDEKYNEIYRKAEEKFFEDLKLYNASPVSEESIKRFNYSEIQIQEINEKAKKNKIFLELVKYLCKDGKILIDRSALLNKQMAILDEVLLRLKSKNKKSIVIKNLKVPEPFVLGGSFHSNRAKRLRSLEQIKFVVDWGTLELMQEYDEFIRSVPLEKWRRGISDEFESTLGVPVNDAGEIELDDED